MTVYAWVLLTLIAISAVFSPALVGKPRAKSYPASRFIAFLLMLPIFGRVLGWW